MNDEKKKTDSVRVIIVSNRSKSIVDSWFKKSKTQFNDNGVVDSQLQNRPERLGLGAKVNTLESKIYNSTEKKLQKKIRNTNNIKKEELQNSTPNFIDKNNNESTNNNYKKNDNNSDNEDSKSASFQKNRKRPPVEELLNTTIQ